MGLIDDDAVVALSGVTACDHAINAAKAIPIPIMPVEKNRLRMIAILAFVNARFRTLALSCKIDVVQNPFVSWETKNVSAGFVRSCE